MDEYIQVKEYHVKHPRRVVFFFPAGFTKLWQYRWTFRLLNRQGVSVVGFEHKWREAIADFDMDDTVHLVEYINKRVGQKISEHGTALSYTVFGSSFGSVPALYAAKRHDAIDSVILNVPYGTMSNVLWHYKPGRSFLDKLKASGVTTEAKLHKLTQPIETQKDLHKLKNKKVVSFLARNDKIVLDGQKLVDALQQEVPGVILHETQYGHFWGGIENILRKSKWDGVLRG